MRTLMVATLFATSLIQGHASRPLDHSSANFRLCSLPVFCVDVRIRVCFRAVSVPASTSTPVCTSAARPLVVCVCLVVCSHRCVRTWACGWCGLAATPNQPDRYGHGQLHIKNSTHALWEWVRDDDPWNPAPNTSVGDQAYFVRGSKAGSGKC
jgi:hypothetical protein